MSDTCIACGKCCQKHWLVKLSSNREIAMFKDSLIGGEYMYTDSCRFLKDGKCKNHGEHQPFKCKEYFCEGKLL